MGTIIIRDGLFSVGDQAVRWGNRQVIDLSVRSSSAMVNRVATTLERMALAEGLRLLPAACCGMTRPARRAPHQAYFNSPVLPRNTRYENTV